MGDGGPVGGGWEAQSVDGAHPTGNVQCKYSHVTRHPFPLCGWTYHRGGASPVAESCLHCAAGGAVTRGGNGLLDGAAQTGFKYGYLTRPLAAERWL